MDRARAHYYVRGFSLPPRGSAQDLVLREVYRRELGQKIAQTALFARLLGVIGRIKPKALENVLKLYIDEVTQDRYATKHIADRRKQQSDDKKHLERAEKYSTPDVSLPGKPPRKGRRRRKPRK